MISLFIIWSYLTNDSSLMKEGQPLQDQIYNPRIVAITITLDIVIIIMLLDYFLNLAIFINSIWRLTTFLTKKNKVRIFSMVMTFLFAVAYTNEVSLLFFFYWGAPAIRMVSGSENSNIRYCIPYDSQGFVTGPFNTVLIYLYFTF